MVGDDPLTAGVEGLEDEELEEGAAAGADQAGDGVVAALAAIGASPSHFLDLIWLREAVPMVGDGKARDITCYEVVVG